MCKKYWENANKNVDVSHYVSKLDSIKFVCDICQKIVHGRFLWVFVKRFIDKMHKYYVKYFYKIIIEMNNKK